MDMRALFHRGESAVTTGAESTMSQAASRRALAIKTRSIRRWIPMSALRLRW